MSRDRPAIELDNAIMNPTKLWRGDELWIDSEAPPAARGIYAWYFDSIPEGVPLDRCHSLGDRWLLYVGISPSSDNSKANLRKRLRQHFRGNARGSTLRRTVGCLLQKELGLVYYRSSPKSMRFTKESEAVLSQWLTEHARVAWATCTEPWIEEERLINQLSLPLNLQRNGAHPFYPELKRMRAEMARQAS